MTLMQRLEKTKEGNRELDCLIWAEISNRDVRTNEQNQVLATNREPPHDACLLGTIDLGKVTRNFQEAYAKPPYPHYTTSRDASLPGENIVQTKVKITGRWEAIHARNGVIMAGEAATEALARRCAALKAREKEKADD